MYLLKNNVMRRKWSYTNGTWRMDLRDREWCIGDILLYINVSNLRKGIEDD